MIFDVVAAFEIIIMQCDGVSTRQCCPQNGSHTGLVVVTRLDLTPPIPAQKTPNMGD